MNGGYKYLLKFFSLRFRPSKPSPATRIGVHSMESKQSGKRKNLHNDKRSHYRQHVCRSRLSYETRLVWVFYFVAPERTAP